MRSHKKFTAEFLSILLVIVAILLIGYGSIGHASTSQQVYRIGLLGSDISTFDPATATDANSAEAIYPVFTGLVSLDDHEEVQPQLAASLPAVSDSGLTYTFTLKPNLHFSDGTPLTTNDVAYSIDRALSPNIANQNGVTLTYLGLIKDAAARAGGQIPTLIGDSLIVVDDSTIKIRITQRSAYFLEALTYPTSYVVEKSVIDRWGAKWTDHLSDNGGQGGDGPWKVQSYSHTTGITLVPNTQYYGKPLRLQVLKFVFYKRIDMMYADYQANQLEESAAPTNVAQQGAAVKELSLFPQLSITYVGMNYLYKPFNSIAIRRAFSLAIDRDAIAREISNGEATPTCHIIPSGMSGYDPNLTCPGGASTKGDQILAQQLFAQGLAFSGLTTDTFPPITLVYPSGSRDVQNQVTAATGMWSSVLGVTINTRAEDFTQFVNDINNNVCQTPDDPAECRNKGLAMWWTTWLADYPDPQDWTTLQFAKGAANNSVNYGQNLSSTALDQQQVQAELVTADADLSADRLALYQDAEQNLVDDVAWLSIDQPASALLIKSYVYGVTPNALSMTPADDWAYIYFADH